MNLFIYFMADLINFWVRFLKESGIPRDDAVAYTASFVENRITEDMLADLTKEILLDLGVTKVRYTIPLFYVPTYTDSMSAR